jgi:hypothetical protein
MFVGEINILVNLFQESSYLKAWMIWVRMSILNGASSEEEIYSLCLGIL